MLTTRNVTRCAGQEPGHSDLWVLTWGFKHEVCPTWVQLFTDYRCLGHLLSTCAVFSLPVCQSRQLGPFGRHLQGMRRLHPVPRGLLRMTAPG